MAARSRGVRSRPAPSTSIYVEGAAEFAAATERMLEPWP
jgi:hypothetical protein